MRWPRFLRRRRPHHHEPPRPRTFREQILHEMKRVQPIDTGRLRASIGDPDMRTRDLAPDTDTGLDHSSAPVGYVLAHEIGMPARDGLTYAQLCADLEAVEADGHTYQPPEVVILCERCRRRRATAHDVGGWLCDPCGDELYPRFEG